VSQALQDAEKCCELKPDWDKAHFRKAAALEASEKDAEALIALEVRKNSLSRNKKPPLLFQVEPILGVSTRD
jgi:hypothetical protein